MNTFSRKLRRKAALFLALLALLGLLSSCYAPRYKNSVYYNDRVDLLALYTYSVPFVADLDVEMMGHVEIYPVEVDEYGRTLGILQFTVQKTNQLFVENAVYCILQSGSKTECCFYEDVCCVMVENNTDPQEAIEQLKQENDWNLPIALDKCRVLPLKLDNISGAYDTDQHSKYNEFTTMACKAVMWPTENAWLEVLCKDGCGLWLFTLVLNHNKENSPVYLIMMQEEPSADLLLSIIDTRMLENRSAPWEEIHSFKDDMGWHFGP